VNHSGVACCYATSWNRKEIIPIMAERLKGEISYVDKQKIEEYYKIKENDDFFENKLVDTIIPIGAANKSFGGGTAI
jgi:hypothetical protein